MKPARDPIARSGQTLKLLGIVGSQPTFWDRHFPYTISKLRGKATELRKVPFGSLDRIGSNMRSDYPNVMIDSRRILEYGILDLSIDGLFLIRIHGEANEGDGYQREWVMAIDARRKVQRESRFGGSWKLCLW